MMSLKISLIKQNINKLQQNEIFSKINEKLGEEISTIRKEVDESIQTVKEVSEKVDTAIKEAVQIAQENSEKDDIVRQEFIQSIQIAKDISEKVDAVRKEVTQIAKKVSDKQNDTTLLNQVCSSGSCLTIAAVLIIAIFIALLLQSQQSITELEQQVVLLQEILSEAATQLNSKLDEVNIIQNITELRDQVAPLQEILYKVNEAKKQLTSLQAKLDKDVAQNITELKQQNILLQEIFNSTAAYQQYQFIKLCKSLWSTHLWLSSEMPNQVAPVIVKVSSFIKKVTDEEVWSSNPFFAFGGGYQMCLKVYTAGRGNSKGTHVSVYLHLTKGPHDDKLEQSGLWPLRGTFTIELLNQLNDSDHYSRIVQFHHHICSECTNRVLGTVEDNGYGYAKFILHDTLLNHTHNRYHKSDFLIFRISYVMHPSYDITPVTFKVTKFSQWLKNKGKWYSSPFFAFKEGYQMCLKVYAAGNGDGEGTHVSVYLYLMKGPHDDKLEQSGHWPLRGTFTIELLNQLNDSDHYSHMMQFHHHQCIRYGNRVLEGTIANMGCKQQSFISHDTLLGHNSNGYLKDDSLTLRISYEDTEPLYQIAPVSFKMTKFSQWLKHGKNWYSSSFFAFKEGYQMSLNVDAEGHGDGEGTHVSVFLHLMKGPHDDKLEQSGHWPLRGTFTIELLNLLNDYDHYSHMVQFHHLKCSECTNRVIEKVEAIGLGIPQFISHYALFDHNNNGYYKNDSLIFRISYEDVEPPHHDQVTPVTFKLTKFSQWLKNKGKWYSSVFFAFKEGYQMCLKVYAAGTGDGEGTHVSVFLSLTKGPHDDKLEQSGHWPLRGTFTIELLNQLNDSDHHSYQLIYDASTDDEVTNRVVEGNIAKGWGNPEFISHNSLLSHGNTVYLKDDTLNFRISFRKS